MWQDDIQPTIIDPATGELIPARYEWLTADMAHALIDQRWWLDADSDQPDRHWNWRNLVERVTSSTFGCTMCIRGPRDDEIQAAAAYHVNARSVLVPGRGAIHIDYLATAPWNRPHSKKTPKYCGGGVSLLRYVVTDSYYLGMGGRVILESLPHPNTIGFYLNRGFVKTGLRIDDLEVFELPPDTAMKLLQDKEPNP